MQASCSQIQSRPFTYSIMRTCYKLHTLVTVSLMPTAHLACLTSACMHCLLDPVLISSYRIAVVSQLGPRFSTLVDSLRGGAPALDLVPFFEVSWAICIA
jgi:hypothetical protein